MYRCKECEDANNPAKLRAEIEALRKQNAKNEDDATRYRWLRAQHWSEVPVCELEHRVGREHWRKAMTPETPEEYRKAIFDMRMTNPFVHRAVTMQEVNGMSTEDMLSILAYHVIKSNDAITVENINLPKRMPPQPLIAPK